MHPAVFTRNVTSAWGDAGRRWLAALPDLVTAVAREWELTVGDPYPLSFNWVAPARRADGSAAVLKLGVPESGHLSSEATALQAFGGAGAVRLLRRDDDRGALLIERAEPGTTLRTLVQEHDEQATAILIAAMRRLHRPAPPGTDLEPLERRLENFAGHRERYRGRDPFPPGLVDQAMSLHADLCASATERAVLHGDLHHENVLAAEREPWLAIDPHGVAGDPGAELGPALYNPLDGDEPTLRLLPRRLEQFADGLGIPLDRVVAWGFAQAVLSEVWNADGGVPRPGRALEVALALRPRLA
ncbi:aminoglycoside phosphotransferase family protein [Actinoplanes sp. NPDC049316]|uniref:aminoglycoside phosphotransferase family protein n=1 Tax=Actinoplanes sp. NPDC049316 TaxID=3154727 RepID=UPI00343B33C0